MKNHFIKKISFKNFKCFDEFNVEGLKRVNLISGKNNIGKTAFMEGVELFVNSNDSISLGNNIFKMIKRRQSNVIDKKYYEIDFFKNNTLPLKLKTDTKLVEIEFMKMDSSENLGGLSYTDEYGDVLKLKVDSDEMNLPLDKMIEKLFNYSKRYNLTQSVNFIKSVAMEERDIAVLYGNLVDLNKEEFLNNSLKLFDENLVALKQKATYNNIVLKIVLKDRKFPILLSSLGEGINRYIAILCAIWASKDGFLFIDEIENGIHYTNYEKLWKIIFEASKMANCQVFATTHSKECIDAFNKCNVDDEGSYLEFYRNKKNKIVVKTRDKELLDYSISHNTRIRGE